MQQEELLLVCEIFKVHFDAPSRELLQGLGRADHLGLGAAVIGGRPSADVRFSAEPQLLEAILASRLAVPDTEVFEYLWDVYTAARREMGAALNQTPELRGVAREAQELAVNYIGLAVSAPAMFPEARFTTPHTLFGTWSPTDAGIVRAQRFLELLLRFRDAAVAQSMTEGFDDLDGVWACCRKRLAQRCAALTAFSPEAADVLEVFCELVRIPAFKRRIVAAVAEPVSSGAEFESAHVLGCFIGLAPIPRPLDANGEAYRQAVYLKMKACRTLSAYRKTSENLLDAYRNCRGALMRGVRELMKNDVEGVNCTEVFLEFLRRALNANAGRASLGYIFSAETQAKLCPNGYAVVLGDVLLELALPVAQRPQLLEKVSLASCALLAAALPDARMALFGHAPEGEAPPLAAAAQFFFFGLEAVTRCFVPSLRGAETAVRALERLTAERKREPKGSFRRKMIATHGRRLKTELACHRLVAEDAERNQRVAELHSALFAKCLSGPFWLPEHHLVDFAELHCFLANITRGHFQVFQRQMLAPYLRLLDALLGEQFADRAVHVRCKFTEPLFAFNMAEKGAGVAVLCAALAEPQLSRLLRGVLGFFASVEAGEGQEAGQDKFRYRLMVSKFFLQALEREEYRAAFVALAATRETNDFFGHLLSDLTYFLETVFANLARLAELERAPPPPEDAATESPEQLQQTSAAYLGFGRSYLGLLERISGLAPAVCLAPAWVRRVAALLNFYAAKLSTKSYSKLQFSRIRELGLRPLDFIRDLVLIYARLGHSEAFRGELLDDARCFDRDTLIDIGSTATQRALVPAEALADFEALIEALDDMRAEREHWNQIIADPPEEFLCQLTYELMAEPVELPASHSTVERKSITEHFVLNGHYDPFNRMRLEPAQLQPLPELQARIAAWIAKRKRELVAALPRPGAHLHAKTADVALYGRAEDAPAEDDGPPPPFNALN